MKIIFLLVGFSTIYCTDQYRHPMFYLTQEQKDRYKTIATSQQTSAEALGAFLRSCRDQNERQASMHKLSFEKYLEQKNFEAKIQVAENALRAEDARVELEAQRKETTQTPKKKTEMTVSNKPKKRSMSNPRFPSIP
jgi:hypothetical protein